MKTKVSIFGSTGSIGKNTVELILQNPERFEVVSLIAGSNEELLNEQVRLLKPKYAALANNPSAVAEAASATADVVIAAIVGIAGLKPTMQAIKNCKILGLANKESMICAGSLMLEDAAKHGTKIIPIDSEHNAIFQVLSGTPEKVTITASGGPFLNRDNLANVTVAEAVSHPKWKMGAKISVDSATLMNKGLELIEAHYLFGLPPEKLEVVVHPESIIHSIVTYTDGSSLAQMGMPDMKTPISYVLAYPERLNWPAQPLDLAKLGSLNFFKPDTKKFKALGLAMAVLGQSQSYHIALNAANEVAVDSFLKGQIAFTQIADVVESAINQHKPFKINSIEDVFEADNQARQTALSSINVAA